MAKYDGLIIPRSYNDYINKSDPLGVSQALALTGVMDDTPTAGSSKPVKSSGLVGFAPVDVVETGNMHPVTSNAVAETAAGIVNTMSYSTSEVNTGKKWTDGKPIYRKVIVDTTPTHNEEILSNVDNLISLSGFILWNNSTKYMFPFILPSGNIYVSAKLLSTNKIALDVIGVSTELTSISAVIEYTKTTD